METVGHSQDPNVQHSVVSLEIEGTVKLEGPGLTEVTLRGEGRDIVLSVPSARQARRLLGRAEVRRLLKTPRLVSSIGSAFEGRSGSKDASDE